MRRHAAWLSLVIMMVAWSASAVEPGPRFKLGVSALKLFGSVGESVEVGGADFTIGVGGFAELNYRFQESFSAGFRWAWHSLGISGHDQDSYESASFQDVLFVTTLYFNPDEDTRPFVTAGLGLSWLGWQYNGPFQPYPDEPNFVINDDRRRGTTFMFGTGAEVAFGDWWEFTPALQLALHGWSDHTYKGVPQLEEGESEATVAPTTVSMEVTLGFARRF